MTFRIEEKLYIWNLARTFNFIGYINTNPLVKSIQLARQTSVLDENSVRSNYYETSDTNLQPILKYINGISSELDTTTKEAIHPIALENLLRPSIKFNIGII